MALRRDIDNQYNLYSKLFQRLKSSATGRDKLILEILFQTGITVSELCNIRVSHIKGSVLLIPKTKNGIQRRIRLPKALSQKIRSFATTGYLFSTRQSPKLSTRRVEQVVKQACKKAGVKITPREIRSLYLSREIEKGYTKEELEEKLALKSIRLRRSATEESIERVEKEISSSRDKLIFSLIKETGITPSEVVILKKKDVKGRLHVRGTTKLAAREIEFSKKLLADLEKFSGKFSDEQFIFTTRQSTQLSVRRIEQLFRIYSDKAGLKEPITPQVLRNYATKREVSENGTDSALRILGIRNITIFSHGIKMKGGKII